MRETSTTKDKKRLKSASEILLGCGMERVKKTTVEVPRDTVNGVFGMQGLLARRYANLSRRPSLNVTAGWLIQRGYEFALKNRIRIADHAKVAENRLQMGIHCERELWARILMTVTEQDSTIQVAVPVYIDIALTNEANALTGPPPAPEDE